MAIRVLITGFEPNDDGINASQRVIESLRDNPPPELGALAASFHFTVMPGDTYGLGQAVDEVLGSVTPDICIGVGQSNYNKIVLERLAKNIRYFVSLDRAGNAPKWELIEDDATVAYWDTLQDIEGTCALLEDHGIPARLSVDSGTHLCNQIFYHFLHWRNVNNSNMRVGFVHIPALPEQVIKQRPDFPFMPLVLTAKAISLVIKKEVEALTAVPRPLFCKRC
jgi:pyroglutamyl-peptidase